MTTDWEVSERKRDRDQGEDRLTYTSHTEVWSHCAAHKGEVRREYTASLWVLPVHKCVHVVCICMHVYLCVYMETCMLVRVWPWLWLNHGCMQWVCSNKDGFFESTSVMAAIHVLVCKLSCCQWSDFVCDRVVFSRSLCGVSEPFCK